MINLRPYILGLLVVHAIPGILEITAAGAVQAMTARQFRTEFEHDIRPGQTREAAERLLREWFVSFQLIDRKDFSRDSATSEVTPPSEAATGS